MTTPATTLPETSRSSENGTAESVPALSSEIDKLVIANISLVLWLVFIAIGGGLLALYYARIGYLPEIEWKAVLIYLFIGTVVGGAIGLLLTISLFLPGVLWCEFIIFDRFVEKHFSYDQTRKEPCMRSIIVTLGGPFLVLLLISHAFLLVGRALLFWLAAAVILILTFWLMRLRFEFILPPEAPRVWNTTAILKLLWPFRKSDARQTFKFSFWFTLSVLLSQIAMYVIYRLSGSLPWSQRFIALTALCTAGVWLSNHVVAFCYHHNPRRAVVSAIVVAGLLLFTADNFSSLSVRLLNRYGLGYKKSVNLVVTTDGFEIVSSLGVQECGTSHPKTRLICNAEILSKVGDQYFVRVGDKVYVTLPKSEVVAINPLN